MIVGITGGFGLVGKALRLKLKDQVVVLARTQGQLFKNETQVQGNFSERLIADQFCNNLDVLVHTASGVGPRSEYNEAYIKDDLIGTIELAKLFLTKNPNGHFIYLSTAGGLYDLESSIVKTEDSEVFPKSLYGSIKLLVEDALASLHGNITVLRVSAVYGDSARQNQTIGLIDKLLKSTMDEVKVPIFDQMTSARDYLHVNDLISAIEVVIETKKQGHALYNIGTGKETSIEDVIALINSIGETNVKVELFPPPVTRTSLIVNSDKIKNQLGWSSQISLKEGIQMMYVEMKKRINT